MRCSRFWTRAKKVPPPRGGRNRADLDISMRAQRRPAQRLRETLMTVNAPAKAGGIRQNGPQCGRFAFLWRLAHPGQAVCWKPENPRKRRVRMARVIGIASGGEPCRNPAASARRPNGRGRRSAGRLGRGRGTDGAAAAPTSRPACGWGSRRVDEATPPGTTRDTAARRGTQQAPAARSVDACEVADPPA